MELQSKMKIEFHVILKRLGDLIYLQIWNCAVVVTWKWSNDVKPAEAEKTGRRNIIAVACSQIPKASTVSVNIVSRHFVITSPHGTDDRRQ